ncbi:MAG: diguanylate cyclase [Magnetococcales bacterium]|nr:diguanylate cyclase [Magnetococcales bacterium]MBF0157380.1 diguanylate cyclase [Magnetococcales bacterium]
MESIKNLTPAEARDLIHHLGMHLAGHELWFTELVRSFLFGEPLSEAHTDKKSHKCCQFGIWLRKGLPKNIREALIVQDIDFIHRRMHHAFRKCIRSWKSSRETAEALFDEAMVKRTAFQYTVDTMQSMLFDLLLQTDPLTRTLNRSKLVSTLERERQRVQKSGEHCTLSMVDIDFFKGLNDKYGHPFGDLVLVKLSLLLQASVRPTDLVFRYGGEEFLLYLPNTSKEEAVTILERIREGICQLRVISPKGKKVRFTASFGATRLAVTGDVATTIAKADEALYVAKESGRNCLIWKD